MKKRRGWGGINGGPKICGEGMDEYVYLNKQG